MRVGIVLAGGAATRLPNKPLLPMRGGRPVICSSIDLCLRSQCFAIFVVTPPLSPLPYVVHQHYADDARFRYVVQETLTGVPHAAACALQSEDTVAAEALITCCDNIYPKDAYCRNDVKPNVCEIRDLPFWKAMHLAKLREDGVWVRSRRAEGDCLAGWWLLRATDVKSAQPHEETVAFLNRVKADAFGSTDNDFWDIGTADTYLRYWTDEPCD